MKENRKLLKEVLKDIRHDMSDEEVLNLLADSKISVSPESEKEKWCCTIKVDIENSKGQYIEKDKQEATKDGSESTKIQHGI